MRLRQSSNSIYLTSAHGNIFKFHGFYDSSGRNSTLEHREPRIFEICSKILEMQIKSYVWLVTSVEIFGLLMSKSIYLIFSDMFLGRDPRDQVFYKRFCYLEYIFLFNETHLTVYLIKLTRMPVCTWIFISKTWSNLEVLIYSSDHEKLLILLRSLWKCIEHTIVQTRWDQKISSPFWRRHSKDRSLHFRKSMSRKPISCKMVHNSPKLHILKHFCSTKIEVSVFKADFFVGSCMIRDIKRRSF